MIDLKKPLEAFGDSINDTRVTLIGTASNNRVIVEWWNGVIWSFTKKEDGDYYSGPNMKLRNCKADWEKAFDEWQGQPAEQDYSVRQTFKEAFEAGRLWEKKK
jgi:hypothetical protein